MWNIVLVSQTIHARHQTSISRSEAQYFQFCSHRLILWPTLLSSHAACTGQESRSWVWHAPALYPSPTPQQIMNPSPMSLSRDQSWPHTEVDLRIPPSHSFLLKLYFKKQSVVNARTAPASHTLASSSRLTETPYRNGEPSLDKLENKLCQSSK